jgi:hypothetical protein
MSRLFSKLSLVIAAIVIFIGALVFAVRSSREAKRLEAQLEQLQQNQPEQKSEEVKRLVEEVNRLIVLPADETPTVATITDREKLQEVPFFTTAENGDKVLIYVTTRKAFLYRPSSQKLIEVATLNLNNAPGADDTFAPRVALRNGTSVVGLTRRVEDNLRQVLPKIEVVLRDAANQPSYAETIVVDVTGTKKAEAEQLAVALGAKVGSLPTGEAKPDGADFLIIVGTDKNSGALPTANPTE